jgi:MFS family permease
MGEIYFWAYIITGIAPIFMAKWRLSASIQTCSLITLVGVTIKYLSNHHFWWALTGQIILGSSQGFLYCTPGALGARWFPEKAIPVVISLLYYSNSLGVSLGFLIPPFMETPVETSQ